MTSTQAVDLHTTRSAAMTQGRAARQTRYLAQSIRLAEAETPGILRATIVILCATVGAFLVWAAFSPVSEIARAPGEVIPATQSRMVQHRDGGIIAAVLVRDGQIVAQGEPVLRLDDTDVRQDLARAQARQTTLDLQEERLRALIEGRTADFSTAPSAGSALIADQSAFLQSQQNTAQQERAVIDEQIVQKNAALRALYATADSATRNAALTQDLVTKRRALAREGVISAVRLMDTERSHNDAIAERDRLKGDIAATQAALTELERRKQAMDATRHGDAHRELDSVLAQASENREVIAKLENRLENMLVTAPVAGMVQGLNLQIRGSVIQPAEPMMEIVPHDGPMVVTLKIRPADIGHLSTGQNVQLKISSFDFARYGAARGKLQSISPSTFSGQNGERFYEGVVTLDTPFVGTQANRILPGMTVMADIITGQKTILSYLLKPLHAAMSTAFSER